MVYAIIKCINSGTKEFRLIYVCLYTLIYTTLSNVFIIIQLVQQKDGVQTELTRMSLAKTKLESLCRELQKHSKAVVVSELCIKVMSYLRTYIVHLFMSFYALHNVHRVQYTGVFVHCLYMVYCNVLPQTL